MTIKKVSFKNIAAIRPEYRYYQGYYDHETDTIAIDKDCPPVTKFSYRQVLLHEQCHRKIFKSGVKKYFNEEQEEIFCDLWVIVQWPKKKLYGLEVQIRRLICCRGEWKQVSSRTGIIKNMLQFSGVKPTASLVNALL